MNITSDFKIILGSNSPRRYELLNKGNINFEKIVIEVAEIFPSSMAAEEVPEFLSKLKASAFAQVLKPKELVICADTIVIQNGEVIGKPKDMDDAKTTLQKLSGKWHSVVTGVCFKTSIKEHSFSVQSEVLFYPITPAEIEFYISNYKPFDKAGAYGIQDWIGLNKIQEIKGSYTNIVGLPMGQVYQELQQFIINHG